MFLNFLAPFKSLTKIFDPRKFEKFKKVNLNSFLKTIQKNNLKGTSMSVYNISTETPNDKIIFNSSANILTDSPYRQNRLSVINSSSNNINVQSPK